MKRAILIVVLIGGFGAVGTSLAAYQLRGYVVANGGISSPPSSAPGIQAYSTVGQAVIGLSNNPLNMVRHGFWAFGGSRVVAVDTNLPTELSVGLPYPNPTRDQVRFAIALPMAAKVRLEVFDVAGRRVGQRVDRDLSAGFQAIAWRAPTGVSGVMFARVYVGGKQIGERRITLIE
jgi:hypothetical protein